MRPLRIPRGVARLPAALDGYTVVQLSDLHTGAGVPRAHLERAVAIAERRRDDRPDPRLSASSEGRGQLVRQALETKEARGPDHIGPYRLLEKIAALVPMG